MNEQIILGTLLGDAWIYKDKRKNYSFRFSQSIKDYAIWKADQVNLPYTIYERNRFDKRTNKSYYSCEILVKLKKESKVYYHNMFYNPKKEVSQEILNKLDSLAVTIWYLDDGNIYYNNNNCHITLSINGFSFESKERIIKWFKKKYNLNFKHSSKAIRITSKKECQVFMDIVEKHVPECMKYKTLSTALEKYHNSLTQDKKNKRWKRNRK